MKTTPSSPKKSATPKAPSKKAPKKKPVAKKASAKKTSSKKAPVKRTSKKKPVDALRARVDRVVEALESKKGGEIVVLKVTEVSSVTDYMVLCTGLNTPHLRALTDEVIKQLRLETPPVAPYHRAGGRGSDWLVLDYVDIIIHLFTPAMRTYYALEQLWKDAPIVK